MNRNLRFILKALIAVLMAVLGGYLFLFLLFPFAPFANTLVFLAILSLGAVLILWRRKKTRAMFIPLGAAALLLTVWGGMFLYHRYFNSLPGVYERDMRVYEYLPFDEDSKIARLDGPAGFRFSGGVPAMDGATALYPLYSAFAAAVYPPDRYQPREGAVMCSGTRDAYARLVKGEADLIICAGPSEAQVRAAEDAGVRLELTPLGREAFVFFVNRENPVESITQDQIRRIYSGKLRSWRELGGRGRIMAFQRPAGSGSQTMLEQVMGDAAIRPPITENVATMGGMIQETAAYRNFGGALGYTFLYYATGMVKNDMIKLLAVDGVYPSARTAGDRSYPFVGEFFAVTREDPGEDVRGFIAWMLSAEGQALVEKTGYFPLDG